MSYTNGMNELADGVQNISINQRQPQQQVPNRKRTARMYHNIQNPAIPTSAVTNAAIGQLQSPLHTPGSNNNGYFNNGFQQDISSNASNTHSAFSTPGTSDIRNGHSSLGTQNFGELGSQPSYQHGYQHDYNFQNSASAPIASADSLSVPFVRKQQEDEYATKAFRTFQNTVPPTATTKFVAIDQGTANPKFMRLSMYNIPKSENLRNATKLPLGLTIRPFAPLEYNEDPVPEVDLTQIGGPLRCRRCRTYLNPEMRFTVDQKFVCNMCKFATPVPVEYISPIDSSGKRLDFLQRPELHKGVVDFIVPESYWVDDNVAPSPLHHIFLIDVSAPSKVVRAATEAIRSTLDKLPDFVKIAVITYDERVQFYNLNSEQPEVHIASDLEDPFIPFYEGLFVNPQTNVFQINDALNKIDELYNDFKGPEVVYGAALQYARIALANVGGGKVTALLSKLPSRGPGALINPSNNKHGTETFKSESIYYNKLADEFISSNVGLDLFVFSKSAVDLINSAQIVFKTSGFLKIYADFIEERDERLFVEDFKSSVLHTRGYQGQLKLRCSAGLQVNKYYGNFEQKGATEPRLPILSENQQYSVLLNYDDKLNTKQDAHFQAALLYTGNDGKRRVRVINLVAAVSDDINSIFSFLDQDVVLDIIVKDCLSYLTKQEPYEIKASTTKKLAEVFTQYRALASPSNLLPTQLVVPNALSSLIAYISSFQKSKIFKTSSNNNLIIFDYYKLNALPLDELLLKLYPRIIAVHNLAENEAVYDDTTGYFNLPENIRASSQNIEQGGAYLLFNGENLYLWVHNNVNPLLLQDLFGVGSVSELSPSLHELPEIDTHISLQARNLVNYFRSVLKQDFLSFKLIISGTTAADFDVNDFLLEDRSIDKTPSSSELLNQIHKQIRERIEKDQVIKANEVKHDDSTLSQRFVHF